VLEESGRETPLLLRGLGHVDFSSRKSQRRGRGEGMGSGEKKAQDGPHGIRRKETTCRRERVKHDKNWERVKGNVHRKGSGKARYRRTGNTCKSCAKELCARTSGCKELLWKYQAVMGRASFSKLTPLGGDNRRRKPVVSLSPVYPIGEG